jgi:outer membrane protein OmpA-like peptidoglycan-associated protein
VGKTLTLGAASTFALDAAGQLHAGPELRAETVLGDGAKLLDPRSSSLQLLATVLWRVAGGPLETALSFGPGLGQAAGAADYRGVLSLSWSPETPPPLPDRDDDTVPDETDACANIPGAPSSDPLMNGCPEVPPDFDGDAIADAHDACPKIPGVPTAARKTNGCPKQVDTDRDQIADVEDACPTVPGVASTIAAENGCPKRTPPAPPPPQARLVERQITISEQVLFETGTANIDPVSGAILQEVATVLRQHPEIELLEVQGHTDNVGGEEFNRHLSQERARAVVSWLSQHGVDDRRLLAKGYGTSHPVANNESEEGRTKNRRVEFQVLRTGPEASKP